LTQKNLKYNNKNIFYLKSNKLKIEESSGASVLEGQILKNTTMSDNWRFYILSIRTRIRITIL